MLTALCATENSRTYDEWRQENKAFAEAIRNCDEETYQEITAILEAVGLLHE